MARKSLPQVEVVEEPAAAAVLPRPQAAPVVKVFICEDCGKEFPAATRLNQHKITHNPLTCAYCDKRCKSYSHMQYHMSTAHDQKQVTCKECKQVFTAIETYKVHKNKGRCDRKLQGEMIPCDQCEKVFETKANMRRHAKKHN